MTDAFCVSETFRKNTRSRPIVVVGIVGPVRVELDLAALELEVRGVVEAIIGIRLLSVFIHTTNSRASSLLATRHAPVFVFYVKADIGLTSSLPNTDKQCLCDDSALTASINTVILTISLSNKESTVAEIHKRLLNTVTHWVVYPAWAGYTKKMPLTVSSQGQKIASSCYATIQKSKVQQDQTFNSQRSLRKNTRSRPIEVAGRAGPARVEPDPAAPEPEVRGAVEATLGIRVIKLVASAVDPEIVIMLEAL